MLQQILGGLAGAILPSLVAFCFCYYVRPTSKKIAHMALIMLLVSLFLPALKIQALEIPRLNNASGLFYGWQVVYLSFSPLILTPPGMMSAVANILFVLAYLMLLCKSDRMFYLSRFNPGIAMAATTLSLFSGLKGFLDFDFRYHPENRIYFGAGTWICSHVLLAIAYSKFKREDVQLHHLRVPSYGLLMLIGIAISASVIIWSKQEKKPQWQRVDFVAFSPSDDKLYSNITNLDGTIYDLKVNKSIIVWNLQTKQVDYRFSLPDKYPDCYELSPMGDVLAYGVTEGPGGTHAKSKVVLASTKTGEIKRTIEGHFDEILDIAFSGDGSTIATAGRDNTVRLTRVSDGGELARFDAKFDVMSVALSRDASKLAYTYHTTVPKPIGSLVYIEDLKFASEKTTLLNSVPSSSMQVAFSYDSTRLACVSWEGVITTWDLEDISRPVTIPNQVQRVTSLRFSPINDMFAYGSYEKVAVLWDCEQGKAIGVLQHPVDVKSIAFSPDGKLLATGEGGTWDFEGAQAIRFWNVATGQLESTLDPSLAR